MPEKTSLSPIRRAVGWLTFGAATLLWACSAPAASVPTASQTPGSPAAPPAPAAAPGVDLEKAKATFEAICSGCHETALATDQRYDRKGWEQLVDRMYGLGMSASDQQAREIVEYLSANYPTRQ